jgi:hypothetical protein
LVKRRTGGYAAAKFARLVSWVYKDRMPVTFSFVSPHAAQGIAEYEHRPELGGVVRLNEIIAFRYAGLARLVISPRALHREADKISVIAIPAAEGSFVCVAPLYVHGSPRDYKTERVARNCGRSDDCVPHNSIDLECSRAKSNA